MMHPRVNPNCRCWSEKRYWRLRDTPGSQPEWNLCAEREQPICTASRWQLMESLSGTAVSSTVAIVGSIWPKGPAQAGPATQAQ